MDRGTRVIDEKYPMLKKYKLQIYYTQIGPILVPPAVEQVLEELDRKIQGPPLEEDPGEH